MEGVGSLAWVLGQGSEPLVEEAHLTHHMGVLVSALGVVGEGVAGRHEQGAQEGGYPSSSPGGVVVVVEVLPDEEVGVVGGQWHHSLGGAYEARPCEWALQVEGSPYLMRAEVWHSSQSPLLVHSFSHPCHLSVNP